VRAISGVTSAAFSTITPFSYASTATAAISVDGYVPPVDQQPSADYNAVSPDYFATMGIPIVAGRAFTAADDQGGAPVAIVDQTMAELFLAGSRSGRAPSPRQGPVVARRRSGEGDQVT
jgi:putative ABC transport system permease protein